MWFVHGSRVGEPPSESEYAIDVRCVEMQRESNLGLLRAVEKFDQEHGEPDQCDSSANLIVKELNVYLRTARKLFHKLDYEPSAEEIAE